MIAYIKYLYRRYMLKARHKALHEEYEQLLALGPHIDKRKLVIQCEIAIIESKLSCE